MPSEKTSSTHTNNDDNGDSPLHYAIFHNDINAILGLTKDLNHQNKQGNTPLHIAAMSNSTEGIRELLEQGANPHIKNNEGQTPLYTLCTEGIYSESSQEEVTEHLDNVQLLLNHNANPNDSDHFGRTSLHQVVKTPNIELIKLLLEAKASPSSKSSHDITPISWAQNKDTTLQKQIEELLQQQEVNAQKLKALLSIENNQSELTLPENSGEEDTTEENILEQDRAKFDKELTKSGTKPLFPITQPESPLAKRKRSEKTSSDEVSEEHSEDESPTKKQALSPDDNTYETIYPSGDETPSLEDLYREYFESQDTTPNTPNYNETPDGIEKLTPYQKSRWPDIKPPENSTDSFDDFTTQRTGYDASDEGGDSEMDSDFQQTPLTSPYEPSTNTEEFLNGISPIASNAPTQKSLSVGTPLRGVPDENSHPNQGPNGMFSPTGNHTPYTEHNGERPSPKPVKFDPWNENSGLFPSQESSFSGGNSPQTHSLPQPNFSEGDFLKLLGDEQ